ncbi:cytochrome c biogenesis protein DipZ [Candidatus Uhrbacteria bacterium]|nr:cytochrome c biogenesis protein DipZ [Candidatus Uhrbacteria bacterium]
MLATALTLFAAGMLTVLLPCILPLLPIILGVSVTGRSRWQPLLLTIGMVVSFVASTFILQVAFSGFPEAADIIRISSYYLLFLFGAGFVTGNLNLLIVLAVLGGFFYWDKGWITMTIAQTLGATAVWLGGLVAARIQQAGANLQSSVRTRFAGHELVSAFLIGMTMGLVWVPCAGPALSFAFTLVRDEPGLKALALLSAYGLGAGVPLLLIGYGGQYAVSSARALTRFSGSIKLAAGVLLMITAVTFQYGFFLTAQTWLVNNTTFGTFGTKVEEWLFPMPTTAPEQAVSSSSSAISVPHPGTGAAGAKNSLSFSVRSSSSLFSSSSLVSSSTMTPVLSNLPKISRAPEFAGLGPWHNSPPLTMAGLKGKVVLIDFWTYSCINCIRTLPYVQGYWDKYKDEPFVLVGVHTPEFVFEKSESNVADAIARHRLTYPVAQDNDFKTWNAFANRYWPAKYLIDAEGYIRYVHFGEGDYEETDQAIAALLLEMGVKADGKEITEEPAARRANISPETYLSSRSWPAFANPAGEPDATIHVYTAPANLSLNQYALVGQWQLVNDEYEVLRSAEGEIQYRALAGEVNLVLGLEDGIKSVSADVYVDGAKTKSITIDRHDLFNLYKGSYGEHTVVLKIHGKGVQAYAYTFGG